MRNVAVVLQDGSQICVANSACWLQAASDAIIVDVVRQKAVYFRAQELKSLALPVPIPKVGDAVLGGGKQEVVSTVCVTPQKVATLNLTVFIINVPILLSFINTVSSERGFRLGIKLH